MSITSRSRTRGFLYLAAMLVGLHFYARPRLFAGPASPDFLLLALLLFAMRVRPGAAAVAGFAVGLVLDVLGPARFGAAALAHTLVAWLASWSRAVFFADNLLVNAGFFAVGTWLRNVLLLVASGTSVVELATMAGISAPLQAATTALVGVLVVILFRDWLAPRWEG